MLIFFFLLATAKYFDCNSTNCQIRLDYPKPICFNLSKDNHAIGCDNEILTIIDYYYIYEGFKFIGFEPKLNDFNTALLSNQQLINFINQLDKYIPCIPQVDDIIQKLYDNFTDIFVEIKDRYQKYLDNNINECNLDVILSLECEFELISKIPC